MATQRGIFINDRFYNYISGTFRESFNLKNSVNETQGDRTFSVQGRSKEDFAVTIRLENEYDVRDGEAVVGSTTWLGVSRLADLKSYLGATTNLPFNLVTPYGVTYSVIPTGTPSLSIFNADNPSTTSVEPDMNLSFASK